MKDKLIDYWTAYYDLAANFERLGDHEEVVFCTEQLVRLFPGLVLAWHRHAEALLKAKNLTAADEAFERAVGLDRLHPELIVSYARRLKDKSEYDKAYRLLAPVLKRRPAWEPALVLACELLIALKRTAEAKELVGRHLVSVPGSFPVQLSGLRILYSENDPEVSLVLAQCVQTAAAAPDGLAQLIELLLDMGQNGDALRLTQEMLRGRITARGALACSAALEANGHLSGALTFLERFLAAAPDDSVREKARELAQKRPPASTPARKRTVLMVTVTPRIREAKLAHALKLSGWDTVLLHHFEPNYDKERFFAETHKFSSPDHALAIAGKLNIPIHHVFTLRGDEVATAFVREKPAFTLIDISDIYDGLMYHDFELHNAQRYCLTNADGLVCRELNPRYACKLGRYERPAHVLYFPEYCWGLPGKVVPERPRGEIHVVQGGWIDIERYGVKNGNCMEVVESFARAEIDVHIYQHLFTKEQSIEEVYRDFIALGKETGRVHIHPNVPLTEIVSEFERYDLGMLTILPYDEPERAGFRRIANPLQVHGTSAARCTDYTDAALPVILSPEIWHQSRNLQRYGIYIPYTKTLLQDPRKVLLPFCGPEKRAEVRRKSARFSLPVQAPRLVRFYDQCLKAR